MGRTKLLFYLKYIIFLTDDNFFSFPYSTVENLIQKCYDLRYLFREVEEKWGALSRVKKGCLKYYGHSSTRKQSRFHSFQLSKGY